MRSLSALKWASVCCAALIASISISTAAPLETSPYLVITDCMELAPAAAGSQEPGNRTIRLSGERDLADAIQEVINTHPNRTIFFPDGEYLLSKPIYTPADPRKSVSLKLADFAVFKATGDWKAGEALVQLGGIHPANDTNTNGSNYSFEGGILDGSEVANGLSINGGRETAVRNVSIKHTVLGLHIQRGANSGSSDADIFGVNIIGTGKKNSVGIFVEGYDNTLTNIRIGKVFIGVHLKSAGNVLRNVHPLYYSNYEDYPQSTGFLSEGQDNWYDYCYSDQFGTGFRTTGNGVGFYQNCFCYWYSPKGQLHTAFKADKQFNSIVTNFRIGFRDAKDRNKDNCVLLVGEAGGNGTIDHLSIDDESLTTEPTYKAYLDGKARGKK